MENKNLYLIFVNPIGKTSNNIYEYEFFFSETPEIVWGENWSEECPAICDNLLPDSSTYSLVKRLKTHINLFCAQNNYCFPFYYCIDGLICLCAEDISNYDSYPEPYRLVLHFGDKYEYVEEHLARLHQFFDDITT